MEQLARHERCPHQVEHLWPVGLPLTQEAQLPQRRLKPGAMTPRQVQSQGSKTHPDPARDAPAQRPPTNHLQHAHATPPLPVAPRPVECCFRCPHSR